MTERSKLLRYFLKDWTGKLSLVLTVVALFATLFTYNPVPQRVPILIVDPVRTTIINSKLFPNSSLKVTRGNDTIVKDDVTALSVYFWNDGKQSIKPENVLQPLTISLNDANVEILDYKILKVSRPGVVKASLTPSDKTPARELLLSFNILEKNDGFNCQIIYAGNPSAELKSSGVIEGFGQINNTETVISGRSWSDLIILVLICLSIVGVAVYIYLVFRFASWRPIILRGTGEAKDIPKAAGTETALEAKSWKSSIVRSFPLMLACGVILCMVFVIYFYLTKEASPSSVLEAVPSSIKP